MSLRKHAQSAVIWNAGFNLFRDLLQFGVMVVLVRLLQPEAYGQFGLVNSIVGFLAAFSFNRFNAYMVQVRDDKDVHHQDHFTAGAFIQIGMFLITNLVAVVIKWVPAYAAVSALLHVMSAVFLLEWTCEFRIRILERSYDWKRLRILHAIGLVMNGLIAVGMALAGCGVYALLVPGLIVTIPFTYDLFFHYRWRPTWEWSWKNYKPAWQFGLARMGSTLTLNGRQLLESSLLAAVLGFAALGVLNRSLGLSQMFCYKVATQLIYAIYPVLTRVEGGEENSQRVGGLVLRTVAWTVIPTAVCFGVLAGPVVKTVYGAKWLEVIPLLPWAMAWGAMASLVHASYMLLLSRHQPRKCLLADVLTLVGTGLCLWLALPHGVVAYLISLVCVQAAVAAVVLFWLGECQAVTVRGVAEALVPSIAGAAVAAVGATAMLRFVFGMEPHDFPRAAAWGFVFMVFYLAILRLGFVRQLSALLYYFPARGPLSRILAIRPS